MKKLNQQTIIELPYEPGFDWASMLAFIAPRVIPGVESIQDDHYQRTFRLNARRGWLKVTNCRQRNALQLKIYLEERGKSSAQIACRVRAIFDLDTDMLPILQKLHFL